MRYEARLLRLGSGAAETSISPLVLILLAISIAGVFLLPRRYVIVPLLFSMLFIPLGQVLVIAGAHFMTLRIMVIVTWLRLMMAPGPRGQDSASRKYTTIDKLFLWWAISSTIAFIVEWGELAAVFNRIGFLLSSLGVYFLFKRLILGPGDIDRTIKVFAVLTMFLALFMTLEQITGQNIFSIFGGVPAVTVIRNGKLRSQGPFAHAILAGAFGATVLPLFLALWWQRGSRLIIGGGVIASSIVIVTSASSTPIMACAAGLVALALWPIRKSMRIFRWIVLLTVVGLHIVMKAPVWSLIGRVDLTGSSSGYHRFMLVDQTIKHFSEWFLHGTRGTERWGWDMWDTSNAYVETAVTGGFVTLVLFIAIIVWCFKRLGTARRATEGNPAAEWRVWALGAALIANMAAFLGCTYFDQTSVAWYCLLALISAIPMTNDAPSRSHRDEPVSSRDHSVEPEFQGFPLGRYLVNPLYSGSQG
jgi:hypothetical protein